MKLVEILARDLDEWPEGAAVFVQDVDGDTKADCCIDPELGSTKRIWIRQNEHDFRFFTEIADDRETAIITRADWEAERARI